MNKKNAVFHIGLILFLIIAILWIYPCNAKALSIDGIMSGADDFLAKGNTTSVISTSALGETSDFIHNMLLGVCMVIAVVVGLILGIKYMTATSEDKAGIKETLVPYVVACAITFGAFTIWKLVINIIQ